MTAEFWFRSDNFEILNFQTCLSWKLKNSISQILTQLSSRLKTIVLKIFLSTYLQICFINWCHNFSSQWHLAEWYWNLVNCKWSSITLNIILLCVFLMKGIMRKFILISFWWISLYHSDKHHYDVLMSVIVMSFWQASLWCYYKECLYDVPMSVIMSFWRASLWCNFKERQYNDF